MSDCNETMRFPDPDEFLDAFKAEMRESGDPVLSEHESLPRLAVNAFIRAQEATSQQPEFDFRCGVCGVDLSPRNRDGRCRWGTDGLHEWKKARMVRGCACDPRRDAPLSACVCAGEKMSAPDVDAVVAQMVR